MAISEKSQKIIDEIVVRAMEENPDLIASSNEFIQIVAEATRGNQSISNQEKLDLGLHGPVDGNNINEKQRAFVRESVDNSLQEEGTEFMHIMGEGGPEDIERDIEAVDNRIAMLKEAKKHIEAGKDSVAKASKTKNISDKNELLITAFRQAEFAQLKCDELPPSEQTIEYMRDAWRVVQTVVEVYDYTLSKMHPNNPNHTTIARNLEAAKSLREHIVTEGKALREVLDGKDNERDQGYGSGEELSPKPARRHPEIAGQRREPSIKSGK